MELKDIAFAQHIARMAYDSITKSRWNPDKLSKLYANRSGAKILMDGDTFYMGTCPDLTLATGLLLEAKREKYQIVIEMFEPNQHFPLVRPHLSLELPSRDLYIDFTRLNEVKIGKGQYRGNGNKSKIIGRISSDNFTAKLPLHKNLGFTNREEMDVVFPNLSIQKLIEKMNPAHTHENYKRYCTQVPLDIVAVITETSSAP
jgi:hypothetical protein